MTTQNFKITSRHTIFRTKIYQILNIQIEKKKNSSWVLENEMRMIGLINRLRVFLDQCHWKLTKGEKVWEMRLKKESGWWDAYGQLGLQNMYLQAAPLSLLLK